MVFPINVLQDMKIISERYNNSKNIEVF